MLETAALYGYVRLYRPALRSNTRTDQSHCSDGVPLCAIYVAWQGLCIILHSLCLFLALDMKISALCTMP